MRICNRLLGVFLKRVVFGLLVLILAGCASPKPVTTATKLQKALGLDVKEGWIVLARPNSIWTVGTVIEEISRGSVKDLGTVQSLKCFPDNYWHVEKGSAPETQYGREVDYNFSLSATLGLPKVEIAKAGLNFGGDGTTPTHKSTITLLKSVEERVDFLKAEEFIRENYESMSGSCKQILTDATRFVIDKVMIVEDGTLSFKEASGMNVNLSAAKYKVIKEAAVKAGYSVNRGGSLKVKDGSRIVFAVRQADFGKVLEILNIKRRGEGRMLNEVLIDANEAIVE